MTTRKPKAKAKAPTAKLCVCCAERPAIDGEWLCLPCELPVNRAPAGDAHYVVLCRRARAAERRRCVAAVHEVRPKGSAIAGWIVDAIKRGPK